MDKTLAIIGKYMPAEANYRIENYVPLSQVWTWKVPERYVVHEAYLEIEDGERVVDFKDSPLHIISYSLPVDKVLTWDELAPHLRFSEKRPNAVPWEFKYYERDWGFCLTKNQFDKLPRDKKYHAVIRSEFLTDPESGFRVGVGLIEPDGGSNPAAGEFIVQSHTCHPAQANDDGSGVVCEIELARRLAENPLPAGSMSVRFWFGAETIGTVAYLAHHEDLIPNLRGGLFLDSIGSVNSLALQRSRQDDHLLDRVARHVLVKRGQEFREGEFAQVAPNDERIINGPGVGVPAISLSRFPYPEYHTSDDNLDIIHEDLLLDAVDAAEEIIRIYASNYIPRRTFRGPVFLSEHSLWVDWRENWDLNRAIEKIMMMFEGKHTIFYIAEKVGLDYWMVREYVEKFRAKGLVNRLYR
ncbi:Putative polysaccharide biosynthesis protein with aminopeptidase-like domain protein [Anaerolineales bacterium]|nr:Putative polysaccharide biosynthesis protein with aminopeptidase-like domain protein [Anaerolineales bacterium]